jgi:hypothetical protein
MTFSSADDADTDGSERKTQNNEAIAFLVQRMNQPWKRAIESARSRRRADEIRLPV